ncbi:hypothetical protein ABTX35_24025 [Streptomyces sp. NPDC096080]|uniref:hypothetical protein n=1 Tax=Streptomyces sp. NPDC096080 TaxID=3156693 RepID=UPI003325BAE2
MNIVRDLYLGWARLAHSEPCEERLWEEGLRFDLGRRGRLSDAPHGCESEECTHATRFPRTTIRFVCRGCGAVHVFTSENVGTQTTTTAQYGYGHPARRHLDVWLWPGELTLPGMRSEPREWFVTRTPTPPVCVEDVAGTITRHWDPLQTSPWQARAVADPKGQHLDGEMRWARARNLMASLDQAASWVDAQYKPQRVEVKV